MVLQWHYGPPRSILGPSSLKNKFRALKTSAFERELNFKKSYMIFGDLEPERPLKGVTQPSKYVSYRKLNLKLFYIWQPNIGIWSLPDL